MRNSSTATSWYAVSAILAMQRRTRPRYLVFENVYLVRAKSPVDARKRGAILGQAEARAQDGLTWNGQPAQMVFGGIRKVVACAANPGLPGDGTVTRIHEGAEATYSRFLVQGKAEFRKLIEGKPVPVVYEE